MSSTTWTQAALASELRPWQGALWRAVEAQQNRVNRLMFREAERVAQDIGVTPVQMRRRFMDTVSRSRRFEIYDSSSTVTDLMTREGIPISEIRTVEEVLRDPHYGDFLALMYGNKPTRWRDDINCPGPATSAGPTT